MQISVAAVGKTSRQQDGPSPPAAVGAMVQLGRTLTDGRGGRRMMLGAARGRTIGELANKAARETKVLRTTRSKVAAIDKASDNTLLRDDTTIIKAAATSSIVQKRTWTQVLAGVLAAEGAGDAQGDQEHEAARRNGTWPFYGPRQRIGDRLKAEREEKTRRNKEEFDAKRRRMDEAEWQTIARPLGPRSVSTAPEACDSQKKKLEEIPSA